MKAKNRPAFTLIELLTVVAIISLLISILVPALGRAREMGHRAACSANQAAIMKGMLTYAAAESGQSPNWGQVQPGFLTVGRGWDWNGVDGAGGAYSAGTYANNDTDTNSVTSNTRNYYLLVRKGLADPKNFQCASDSDGGQPFLPGDPAIAHDFQRRSQVSFSMQYLGPASTAGSGGAGNGIRTGWPLNLATGDPKMVIIADKSPLFLADTPVANPYPTTTGYVYQIPTAAASVFCTQLAAAEGAAGVAVGSGAFLHNQTSDELLLLNSLNHRGEGQNVARLDGSVIFANTPWQGAANDNIWTVQDGREIGNTNLPAAPAAPQSLIARVGGAFPGGTQNATTELDMLDQWMLVPAINKNKYPDSFLAP